jgi:hypothetical protein
MKATGERPEPVAAVDRCQGAPSTQADVGHRNRNCSSGGRFGENCDSKGD